MSLGTDVNDEKKAIAKILNLKSRDRARRRTQRELDERQRASSRRAGRGSGTDGGDLWDPSPQADGYVAEDDRRGLTLCSSCGLVVRHVQVDGEWYVRNEHDDLPHLLSCEPA